MDTLALIGLGSNLGDRRAHLDAAVAALRGTPGVVVHAVSSYHETRPVGGPPGQGSFLNAAARLESSLDALGLLRRLREIEREAGRVRVERWGERTLDLDLLMFDSRRIETPELTLPHPRMAVRRFVLAPLAEIAPEIVDTTSGLSISGLLENLDRRPSHVALHAPPGMLRDFVFDLLSVELGAVSIRGADELERMTFPRRGPDPPPPLDLIEPLAARIRATDWGDDWVVSDFCAPLAGRAGHELMHIAPNLPLPTFGVVLASPTSRYRPYQRFPLLRIASDDPEAVVSEILAACRASRPG